MKLVPDDFDVPAGLETARFRLRMLTVRDALATCWVRREATELDGELYEAFRAWLERDWPFARVAYPGRDA